MSNLVMPHDKFFHSAMTNLKVAKEFVQKYLPERIQKINDINTLRR